MTDEQDPIYDPRKSKAQNAARAAKEVITANYSTPAWLVLIGLNVAVVVLLLWVGRETSGVVSIIAMTIGVLNGLETLRQIGMRLLTGW